MGQNLIFEHETTMASTVVAFNRTVFQGGRFFSTPRPSGTKVVGAHSIEEMVALLKKPRPRHAYGQ